MRMSVTAYVEATDVLDQISTQELVRELRDRRRTGEREATAFLDGVTADATASLDDLLCEIEEAAPVDRTHFLILMAACAPGWVSAPPSPSRRSRRLRRTGRRNDRPPRRRQSRERRDDAMNTPTDVGAMCACCFGRGLPTGCPYCTRVSTPAAAPAMGCICPPGANKDCEAPLCPRRNPLKVVVTAAQMPRVFVDEARTQNAPCGCHRCIVERGDTVAGIPLTLARMILCPRCGNKRCPHASDHRFACTGSNAVGQEGSRYA